jgi:hypothetical protein
MKRKRAPGGGRKARAGPTSSLTFRIPDDMRKQLEREAAEKAVNVSDRLLWHLRRSFNRQREEERDPALQGLLVLIARLAENVTHEEFVTDKYLRSRARKEWRTDLFQFRTFKFAVKKLLDTLEEPPEHALRVASLPILTEEEHEKGVLEILEDFGDPELNKLYLEINKSPEAKGAWVFGHLWTRFTQSHLPFTENERSMMSKHPVLGVAMEREYYDFQKARKALELKPPREDLFEAINRVMKDRNLDPENDPAPPDIDEAVKLIADKGRALKEAIAANKHPEAEALKLLASDPLPTLDEALRLIKIRKPKVKSR